MRCGVLRKTSGDTAAAANPSKSTHAYSSDYWCDLGDILGVDDLNGQQELEVPTKNGLRDFWIPCLIEGFNVLSNL